jgi:hypothetical protein
MRTEVGFLDDLLVAGGTHDLRHKSSWLFRVLFCGIRT